MKKLWTEALGLAFLLLLFFTACQQQDRRAETPYRCGLVVTSEQAKKTSLHFYDEKLQETRVEKIPVYNLT